MSPVARDNVVTGLGHGNVAFTRKEAKGLFYWADAQENDKEKRNIGKRICKEKMVNGSKPCNN